MFLLFSFCHQLEKAKEQELLLEQSAKELSVRQDRERELEKLIAEKEVWPLCFDKNNSNGHYYMAKPVLGKSLCSDWFFLGQDFAVRTVSMETVRTAKS